MLASLRSVAAEEEQGDNKGDTRRNRESNTERQAYDMMGELHEHSKEENYTAYKMHIMSIATASS